MLGIHIFVALISLIASALQIFTPRKTLNQIATTSLIATGATGVLLVWQTPQRLTDACISGSVYVLLYIVLRFFATRTNKVTQTSEISG